MATSTNVQAMQHKAPSQAQSIVLLLASMVLVSSADPPPPPPSYRFDLIHVDANGNFTSEELIHRAASRTDLRAATLSATDDSTGDFSATAHYSHHEYLAELKIGDPPKDFLAVADTGSDVTWTKECNQLESSRSFKRMTCSQSQSGDPVCSECSKEHQCIFRKIYGSRKDPVNGFMATDVLTWLDDKKVSTPIGCANNCGDGKCGMIPSTADGIIGLSRSPKSLLSRLGVKTFSYCLSEPPLAEEPERRSKFWLGGGGLTPTAGGGKSGATVNTTSLLKSETLKPQIPDTSVRAYRYYIELLGISIGENHTKLVSKNEEHSLRSEKGNRIMIVDSGCSYTILENRVFEELMELLKRNGLENPAPYGNLSTCFKGLPDNHNRAELVLHFTGANMSLPWASYMMKMNDSSFCLAIKGKTQGASLLGNFQQQNIRMFYDLQDGKDKLSFMRVDDCSKL